MKKNKISAVILIIALLFNSIPFTVFSVDSQENINNVTNDIVDNQIITEADTTNNNDVYIVAEDVSKRTEFEKHYFCSDGTFTVVTYPEAVHYLDENGNWVDIDNSLVLNTSSGLYEATNDDFTLSIAPIIDTQHLSVSSLNTTFSNTKEEQSNLISLVNGDNNLSWTLYAEKGSNQDSSLTAGDEIQRVSESSNKQTVFASASARIIGTIRSSEETNANNSDFIGKNPNDPNAFVLNKVSNSVEYDSIFGEDEGISVRYTISHNKIEEDIFFEKKTNIQSISMSVECGNLTPILNIDNSVDFIDQNGEMIYHISTPYMVDAAFETSNDIEITLTANGKYCIITYILNLDWLNSDDRVYPVILDPSVTTNEYSSNVADTYVVENSTTNHSIEQELYLDCDYDSEGNSLKRKIVISFGDFPEIDPTMPIYSATVNFNVQYGPFSDLVFKLESVEGTSYTVNQMTYARLSNATLTSIAYTSLSVGSTSFSFDITDYVDDLISNELSGMFALSFSNEDSDDYCYPIYSSESASTNLRPHLTIKYGYRLPEDLRNGQSIIIQNYAHGGFLHSNYANNYNVYVKSFSSAANVDTNGTFTIVQNSTTGGYTFCNATNTSNKMTADSSNNVSLSISGTASQNEWLIVPESVSEFRIVLRSDMSKALTAVGSATDGGSDTSLTAIGNVIVQDIMFGSNGDNWDTSQQWTFYTSDGTMINPNYPFVDVSSGEYYLNNTETGKFLYVDSNTVTAHSALTKANISLENAKWYITNLGDNTYTIQNANNLNEFLAIKTDGSTLELSSFYGASTTEIPDRYIWKINWNASQSGCILVNQTYSKRIYATDSGVATETSPASVTNICLWRLCPTYSYIPVTTSNVSFNDIITETGYTENVSISKSEAVNFASVTDFTYTVLSGADYISTDANTGIITANNKGIAVIRATHKTTGISNQFNIFIHGELDTVECSINNSVNIYSYQGDNNSTLANAIWNTSDSSIATISSSGTVTGIKSGYAFVYATKADGSIIYMCEIKVVDPHTLMLQNFTSNEIEYLYCPSSHLNIWTIQLENRFELKVEIIDLLRNYYLLPESQHPTRAEIRSILKNKLNIDITTDTAAGDLFQECYSGYRGLYNQEYLTNARIEYFNYLKEIITFCAFSMAANLDPVNTNSPCQGINDYKEDLATEWTNNPDSDKFMLGSGGYNGVHYADRARSFDCSYFYSNEYDYIKQQYGNNYVREINQIAINRALQEGKTFYFSHNPMQAPSSTSLYMEYNQIVNYYSSIGKTTSISEIAVMIDGVVCTLWKLIVN